MTYTYRSNARPCSTKCRGNRRCVCYTGHVAPHICSDPTCRCHHPASYGLTLDRSTNKYERITSPADVRRLTE